MNRRKFIQTFGAGALVWMPHDEADAFMAQREEAGRHLECRLAVIDPHAANFLARPASRNADGDRAGNRYLRENRSRLAQRGWQQDSRNLAA